MLSNEQRESLEAAVQSYSQNLEYVLPYLESRGIDPAIASSRRLGYVREPIQGHRPARNRLAIPYLTPSGPVGITFRCLENHKCREAEDGGRPHSKYWKPSGAEAEPYGVMDVFKDSLDIHLTEGEIDSIILSELCGLPSMGIPGAQYWKPWWKLILSDFQRIFVWGDGDTAGEQFTHKIQKEMGRSAIAIQVPSGEDVNSLYLKFGAEKIREMAK